MIEVTPKGYRVLIEQIENRSLGKIALPDNTTEAGIMRHRVIAVGDPKILLSGERVPIDVKVGDDIMFDTRKVAACGPAELFGGRLLAIVDVDAIYGVFTGEMERMAPKIVTARPAPVPVHVQ